MSPEAAREAVEADSLEVNVRQPQVGHAACGRAHTRYQRLFALCCSQVRNLDALPTKACTGPAALVDAVERATSTPESTDAEGILAGKTLKNMAQRRELLLALKPKYAGISGLKKAADFARALVGVCMEGQAGPSRMSVSMWASRARDILGSGPTPST